MKTIEDKQSLTTIGQLIKAKPSVNLVLSGGGAKGVAHIALIEFLEEHNITINAISGSSAGALVGALYCSGLRPHDILDFFKSTPIFRYTWLNPAKAGIFDSDKYALSIEKYVKFNFEDLQTPLVVAATNLEKNKIVYFTKGNLIPPLLASCAIPAIFSPVLINGELYSDGGVMDNFPVLPFQKSSDFLIGSYVCKPSEKSPKELNSILKVSNHSNALLLFTANTHKFKLTNTTIVFPLGHYSTLDTKNIDHIYQEAKDYLNRNN